MSIFGELRLLKPDFIRVLLGGHKTIAIQRLPVAAGRAFNRVTVEVAQCLRGVGARRNAGARAAKIGTFNHLILPLF